MRFFRRRKKESDEALEWINAFRVLEGMKPLKEWPPNVYRSRRSETCPVAMALGDGWNTSWHHARKGTTRLELPQAVVEKICYFDSLL